MSQHQYNRPKALCGSGIQMQYLIQEIGIVSNIFCHNVQIQVQRVFKRTWIYTQI